MNTINELEKALPVPKRVSSSSPLLGRKDNIAMHEISLRSSILNSLSPEKRQAAVAALRVKSI